MKVLLFKCVLTGLVFAATLLSVSGIFAQQLPVQYRIHWVDIPVNGDPSPNLVAINDERVVVGWYRDEQDDTVNGFIYDVSDESQPIYHDFRTYFNIPNDPWIWTRCYAINNQGFGAAYLRDAAGQRRGIWFDLATANWGFVPEPVDGTGIRSIEVNNLGDVLFNFVKSDGDSDFYVYNPDPVNGYPPIYAGINGWATKLSDSGHVVGELLQGNVVGEWVFRWMPGDPDLEILDYNIFRESGAINGLGHIAGTYSNSQLSGGGGKQSFEVFRYRTSADVDFLPSETMHARGFNNAGDVAGDLDEGELNNEAFHSAGPDAFVYHNELGLIRLDDVVVGVDSQFFIDAEIRLARGLTNRDATGFGSMMGRATVTTNNGRGKNQVTTSVSRHFVLIPQLLDPVPGISISPTSGLSTTESGGIATFDVVLDAEPSAEVTIGISSSKPAEGLLEVPDPNNPDGTLLVNSYDLVFDSSNWNQLQTVTVVGQGDGVADGNDVAYTIITDLAVSDDGDYNGLDAEDVQVTNLDPSSSATYSTVDEPDPDPPIDIPDNNLEGITSTILVGDHNITGLTVSLNIDHPRPADLQVYLYDPNNDPDDPQSSSVQLDVVSGDNPIDLNDIDVTNSLGFWTILVIDDRKKKTGTLLDWSITVDY